MRAVYINLESATARRQSIEASWARAARPGWSLQRFPAVRVASADYRGERLRPAATGRKLTPAEEGCYLSHRMIIDQIDEHEGPVLVLEDDAVFCPESLDIIGGFVGSDEAAGWDVIYTDVIVTHASWMVDLFRLRRSLAPRQIRVLDLQRQGFASSTAYVVMPRALDALSDALREERSERVPYDMALRSLVYRRRIRACALFPFPTSVSAEADDSQIQNVSASTADLLWNTYRRMMWVGARDEDTGPVLRHIEQTHVDPEAKALGVIVAAMGSGGFVGK